jgi:hypothetical protein
MNTRRIVALLAWLASAVSWVVIAFSAIAMGFGTLPLLYSLFTGQVQPGDLLPYDRVSTVAEYTRELVIEISLIAGGFAITGLARWARRLADQSSPARSARP